MLSCFETSESDDVTRDTPIRRVALSLRVLFLQHLNTLRHFIHIDSIHIQDEQHRVGYQNRRRLQG